MIKVSILIIVAISFGFLGGLSLGHIRYKNKDKKDAELIKKAYKLGEINSEIKAHLNKNN